MASSSGWTKRASAPGSIKPVFGAQYPPLVVDPSNFSAEKERPEIPAKNTKPSLPTGNPSGEQTTSVALQRDLKFASFEASISDAWSLDDPLLFNQAAAHSAAQQVIEQHAASSTGDTRNHARMHHHPSRAKEVGIQLLAMQKDPSLLEGPSDAIQQTAIYPKLPALGSPSKNSGSSVTEQNRAGKIRELLEQNNINLEKLRQECWKGIPAGLRPQAWRLLAGYVPTNSDRRAEALKNKRDEYFNFVEQYFHTRFDEQHQDTFRQIHIDIPRMCPIIPLFQQKIVQELFERILYIWAIRHPASGYVQGINDLVTPFFVVFLSEFVRSDAEVGCFDVSSLPQNQLDVVEADSFWCVNQLLNTIQDNYTFAQPGVQTKIRQLEQLMERVDKDLHQHLSKNQVEYLQFAFRWMNNLLMREIPLRCTIRLWDTYLSEINGFAQFHLYVCAAFLRIWSSKVLQQKDFQNIMLLLQNLPTSSWSDQQISELCADAFSLMALFSGTKNHLLPKK